MLSDTLLSRFSLHIAVALQIIAATRQSVCLYVHPSVCLYVFACWLWHRQFYYSSACSNGVCANHQLELEQKSSSPPAAAKVSSTLCTLTGVYSFGSISMQVSTFTLEYLRFRYLRSLLKTYGSHNHIRRRRCPTKNRNAPLHAYR